MERKLQRPLGTTYSVFPIVKDRLLTFKHKTRDRMVDAGRTQVYLTVHSVVTGICQVLTSLR